MRYAAYLSLVVLTVGCGGSSSAQGPNSRLGDQGQPTSTQAGTGGADSAGATETPSCSGPDACLAVAKILDDNGDPGATNAYFAACQQKSVEGCEQAGLRWVKQLGDDSTGNPLNAKIMESWRTSCEVGGGMHGCGNLGFAYFYGRWDTPVDADKAMHYWEISCTRDKNKFVCRRLAKAKSGEVQPGFRPR